MISYLSISYFRSQLEALLNIRKNVYKGVTDEISKEFASKNICQIRQNRDMILMEEDAIIIKLRLPDKKNFPKKMDTDSSI